ncbi:hypothetical protein I6A84_03375 [Frankia sp. CNm7]|uniref:Uncharacterized protein n=1 Tax=Frankia nepalensis TaxID=1836974 RepID=A0A937RNH9_9ACTN|nr:hypothetical protein [Frankia nepalensis]MBL7498604.1 hypothetical protein [Frankia nepalensis]MBL7510473.1 hypothetical protein [Frankia nepalensis]MBL7517187.1 hypothetical protein [Frankia nepalensis]MBL7630519.1 hypothetical protein [Frankia nepalensis]
MTAPPTPDVDLYIATEEDFQAAKANALRRAGCTLEELREQARTGEFRSSRAYIAWVFLRCLEERARADA